MGAVGPEILLLAAAAAVVRIVLCEGRVGVVCGCVWWCIWRELTSLHSMEKSSILEEVEPDI